MKKFLLLFVLGSFAAWGYTQSLCQIQDQQPLKLLSQSLKRSFKTLRKQQPPVYYLSYTYSDLDKYSLYIQDGGVSYDFHGPDASLQVMVRVGSARLDNTRSLKKDRTYYNLVYTSVPAITPNPDAFKMALWRATQQAVEEAQQDFNRVQADVQTAAQRSDDSADFVLPVKASFCAQEAPLVFDADSIKTLLLKASELTKDKPFVLESSFSFSSTSGSRYFVDSVGTQLKTPVRLARLTYSVEGKTSDGTNLQRTRTYDVLTQQALPTQAQLLADVAQSLQELHALTQAPEAEPATVPAILKNRAMAVFVHEVLGHRVEGHRQKEDSFGKTFTDKVGQPVVSKLLTIVDDPTLAYFNRLPLRGFYQYDDEGVKAQPVVLVQAGILKNFLMSSSPISGFPVSNGHGRAEPGKRPVARMGNTRVIAAQTVPYEQLEEQLLAEVKRQGAPYGVIIEDLSGGFTHTGTSFPQAFKLTPTLVFRIYPDGHKEVVRGVDMVGTPLVSFNEVMAAADDYEVFNGTCGAESGWVPVSGIAPSVLLRRLELEKTAKEDTKPPFLPPPVVGEK